LGAELLLRRQEQKRGWAVGGGRWAVGVAPGTPTQLTNKILETHTHTHTLAGAEQECHCW